MPDRNQKQELNIEGQFYVDQACIDCDLCRLTAPDCFMANEDEGYSYVYRQPATPQEEELCRQAMDECPVEAIGADGSSVHAPRRLTGGDTEGR